MRGKLVQSGGLSVPQISKNYHVLYEIMLIVLLRYLIIFDRFGQILEKHKARVYGAKVLFRLIILLDSVSFRDKVFIQVHLGLESILELFHIEGLLHAIHLFHVLLGVDIDGLLTLLIVRLVFGLCFPVVVV